MKIKNNGGLEALKKKFRSLSVEESNMIRGGDGGTQGTPIPPPPPPPPKFLH